MAHRTRGAALQSMIALLATGGLALSGCSDSRPDVVILVADDLARSDVESVSTPAVDELAAQGVRFSRAYANPVCSPSRRALLFGRWWGAGSGPSCRNDFHELAPSPNDPSLPRMMKQAGYATAIFGKWHLGNGPHGDWTRTPETHGFDTWRAGMPSNVARCGGTDYWKWLRVDDGATTLSRQYNTSAIRDAFVRWWRETDGPRFAYVAFQAPHLPLHVPPARLLAGAPVPRSPTPRQLYELMLISLDHVVGEILAEVGTRETIVVFLGDNGTPSPATRPDQDPEKVKTTTFEDGVNVPLIVVGPGIPAGGDRRDLVHGVDLMATVAELVGIEVPDGLDSRAMRPGQTAPESGSRPYVFSSYIPERIGLHQPNPDLLFDEAVITERFKLRNRNGNQALYDLERDPEERHALAPDAPGWAEAVETLRRHRARIRHGTTAPRPSTPEPGR